MNESLNLPIVEALTSASYRRDKLFQLLQVNTLSDEELIQRLSKAEIDPRRMKLLASASKLLRLMDGLLNGLETGEGFVSKFSQSWLLLQDWDADSILEKEFDKLNKFYSEIQMFCVSEQHKREEPLLFGLERLKELTRTTYKNLRQKWCISLSIQESSGLN